MRRGHSIVGLALIVLLAAGPAAATPPRYWLGPQFASLPLTHDEPRLVVYGDCDPKPDQGCSPPLQVQSWTTCDRNPVGLDVLPARLYGHRGGGIVADYGGGAGLNLMTGRSTATVFANRQRIARRALPALRRRTQDTPTRRLASPVFPIAVVRELKRVELAYRRATSVEAASRAIGLSAPVLRIRLRLARLLPAASLRGVRSPRRSIPAIERDRQVAFWVKQFSVRKAATQFGLTDEQVRRTVRRVRGLVGEC
jgi:hypothetical protein